MSISSAPQTVLSVPRGAPSSLLPHHHGASLCMGWGQGVPAGRDVPTSLSLPPASCVGWCWGEMQESKVARGNLILVFHRLRNQRLNALPKLLAVLTIKDTHGPVGFSPSPPRLLAQAGATLPSSQAARCWG